MSFYRRVLFERFHCIVARRMHNKNVRAVVVVIVVVVVDVVVVVFCSIINNMWIIS